MLEFKALATCTCCGDWWYAIGDSPVQCEQKLRDQGWALRPEICPKCRKSRQASSKATGEGV